MILRRGLYTKHEKPVCFMSLSCDGTKTAPKILGYQEIEATFGSSLWALCSLWFNFVFSPLCLSRLCGFTVPHTGHMMNPHAWARLWYNSNIIFLRHARRNPNSCNLSREGFTAIMWPARLASRSTPNWWRYWSGDVLQDHFRQGQPPPLALLLLI